MKKNKLICYVVIYEKDGKIAKQVFPTIEKAINNMKVLLLMGHGVQISRYETEVDLSCLNVWKQC